MHTKGIGRRQGGEDFTNKLERVMNNDEHSEYKTCEPKQSRLKKVNKYDPDTVWIFCCQLIVYHKKCQDTLTWTVPVQFLERI